MRTLRVVGAIHFAALAALAQSPSVSNLSTRAQVGTGQDLLIVGFNVGPGTDQTDRSEGRVLQRAQMKAGGFPVIRAICVDELDCIILPP